MKLISIFGESMLVRIINAGGVSFNMEGKIAVGISISVIKLMNAVKTSPALFAQMKQILGAFKQLGLDVNAGNVQLKLGENGQMQLVITGKEGASKPTITISFDRVGMMVMAFKGTIGDLAKMVVKGDVNKQLTLLLQKLGNKQLTLLLKTLGIEKVADIRVEIVGGRIQLVGLSIEQRDAIIDNVTKKDPGLGRMVKDLRELAASRKDTGLNFDISFSRGNFALSATFNLASMGKAAWASTDVDTKARNYMITLYRMANYFKAGLEAAVPGLKIDLNQSEVSLSMLQGGAFQGTATLGTVTLGNGQKVAITIDASSSQVADCLLYTSDAADE